MRHRKQGRKLGRTWDHRKALFKNMAKALITHGRIKTTVAKAKELRGVADGLVTLAIKNDLHARRRAFRILGSHQLVKVLFDEIGPRFADSPQGGYTRVVKLATPRPGDSAPLAIIEFTRQPGEAAPQHKTKQSKTKQQAAPTADQAPALPPDTAPAEEAVVAQAPAEAEDAEQAAEAEAVPEAAVEESAAAAEEAQEAAADDEAPAEEQQPAEQPAEEVAEKPEAADDSSESEQADSDKESR